MARVFLSHAEADEAGARRIAEGLRRAGHEPWLFEEEILVGESIPDAIGRGLEGADYVVVCLSGAGLSSGWVERELSASVMRQFASRRERVLPVRLGAARKPGVVEHIQSVDLFPGDEAWERGLGKLVRSIEKLEARRGAAAGAAADLVTDVEVAPSTAAGTAAMVVSPYNPWEVSLPPRFAGRASLWRRLEEALENGWSVSIVGDFRIGKSSILRTWEGRARRGGRSVRWVSGEEASGRSPRSFVEEITGGAAPDDADGAASELDRWARSAGGANLPPLVLVDEVDAMIRRFEARFFERLRGMIGRKAVVLVLSSCRELDRIYKDRGQTSPFDNLLELQSIGLLEPEAAEVVIGWGAGQLGSGGADLMRLWAGRHPFYLQLLGKHLVSAARDGEPIKGAVERFQDEAARHLRALWSTLEERERQDVRDCVTRGTSAQRRSLRRRGIVTEEGKPFGEVLAAWAREEAE